MADVIEVLRKARVLVARPGGWRQGDYGDAACCCSYGAINLASGLEADDSSSCGGAEHILGKAIGDPAIATWNDAPGRTQAEVVAAFDRAIKLAEASNG